MRRKTAPLPPPVLAVANVHPDYIEACLEGCCTGSRFPSRLPEGTITFLRQTAGGQGKRAYGVVGIWYYAGDSRRVPAADLRWPRRWNWRIGFEPLIARLQKRFCEEFAGPPPPGAAASHRSSLSVPGLVYTKLQGTIVRLAPDLGAAYVQAVMRDRKEELQRRAWYLGREVVVRALLSRLVKALEARARELASRGA